MTEARAAVFLDRDGTLSEEVGYMRQLSMFKVFPWTGSAIKRMNEAGIATVVVTNQSGISRGYFDEGLVHQVHSSLRVEIGRAGAHVDAVYYCPHLPDHMCECRKPMPGMLRKASAEMNLDLERSFMIGDRYTDVQAGISVGARTILVLTGEGAREQSRHQDSAIQPDDIAATLEHAVDLILTGRT